VIEGAAAAGDKQYAAEMAGVTGNLTAVAEGEAPADAAPEGEDLDLEAALGGGIRKAPAIVAALDEAEAAETGY